MLARYAVLAAAIGSAAAATSTASACAQATATINSAADATALSSCETLSGSLVIGSDVSGALDLGGIGQITGDLTVSNVTQLSSLTSSSLNSIGGTFTIQQATILSTLTMDALSSVGSIQWATLPALQTFSFGQNLLTSSGDVVITDTFLSDLSPLGLETVGDLDVNNNKHLTSISVPLANASGTISFTANGNGQNFELEFPNLIWAKAITLSNCSVISMPSLETVNDTLAFNSNYVTEIVAANLTSTGSGDLTFAANSKLSNISMNALKSTGGGFVIANNTALMTVDGFAKITTVGGALDFSGNFTDVELPALDDVKGAFKIVSSGNFSCSAFQSLKSSGDIQGSYTCTPTSDNVQSGTGTSSSSGSSSSSSSTSKKGAASAMNVNWAVAIVAAIVAGVALN